MSLPIMEDLSRRNIWSGCCERLNMKWSTLVPGSRSRMMTIQILLFPWPVQLLGRKLAVAVIHRDLEGLRAEVELERTIATRE